MEVLLVLLLLVFASLVNCKINGEGETCGRPIGSAFDLAESRIIAGYDVGYYRYPWYAALVSSDNVACGGVLIGTKTVISAAHCFKEYLDKNASLTDVYNVTLGVYNKCVKEKARKLFAVDKVFIHENYQKLGPYYDISMLVLKEDTGSYQPICLPKTVVKKRPKEGTVPGLGTLKYHGSTPCTLHEARILIYPDEDCRQMINKTGNDPKKIVNAFCAGYIQGGIDTCQGDSGGPLQVVDEYGNYVLLGIVSFGFHCANPGLLGMYTDVSKYIDWIEEKSGISPSLSGNYTTTTSSSSVEVSDEPISTRPPKKQLHHHHHHRFLPFWAPITVILIGRNHKFSAVKKNVLHFPKWNNSAAKKRKLL